MMTSDPVIIEPDEYIHQAEQLMIERKIATILVGSAKNHTVAGVYQIYNG